MDRLFLLISLVLLVNVNAVAADKDVLSRLFRVLPENQSHVHYGSAEGKFFNKNSIKVFIWNIKKSLERNWESEFRKFSKNRDLILIQEAYRTQLFDQTTSSYNGFRWDMGISFLYRRYNNQATGTMIGSNVEPSEVLVKHSTDGEPMTGTPKSITYAKYPIDGHAEELLVVSVHGINLTGHSAFVRHMQQAQKIIDSHTGPVLFAGDFNTRTQMRTKYLLNMIQKNGFKTVTFKNGHHRMRWKFTNNYLDHAFVRGLSVRNAEVIGNSFGSDHKPLFLEMSLTP